MDTDLYLVIGLLLGALAIASSLSAFSDSRPPRLGVALVIVAGVLIVLALTGRPGGYTWPEVPMAFYNVLGRILN